MGYMVAAADFVREARLFRRLILRHPPTNNQRIVALFIAGGYYDALVQRLQRSYRGRWESMGEAIQRYLPGLVRAPAAGGSSFWIEGPADLDGDALAVASLNRGVVIEPGSMFYMAKRPPRQNFRFGFSTMDRGRIDRGIEILSELINDRVNSKYLETARNTLSPV